MTNEDRLKKIERAVTPAEEEIHVFVDWEMDGLVTDYRTGERISEEEWHKRFPDETLIHVKWEDGDDEGGDE